MADVVEVEQTNITVVTDEDKNVVEFRYYGVNERHLDETMARVTEIELTMDEVVAAVAGVGGVIGGATGPLQVEIDALEVVVAAQGADLAAETAARQAADLAIGNDLAALDVELSALIAAEPPARDAAIAVETAARIAADQALDVALSADIDAVVASVAAQTATISALSAQVVALDGDVAAMDAQIDALSGDFATLSAEFSSVQTAVLDEITARAAADVALTAAIAASNNRYFPGGWS